MWCLLLVAALPGDDRLLESLTDGGRTLESEERLREIADDNAGFQALNRKTAHIKKIQDETKAELAQLRTEFGSPSSFAQLPKDFFDAQQNVSATDAAVEAGLDAIERKLAAQETADAKDRAKRHAEEFEQSLLETFRKEGWEGFKGKLKHTRGWHLPESLQAERKDLIKTRAIDKSLHARADAARKRFHDTIEKDLDEIQDEKDEKAAGADDEPHLDAETKAELRDEDAAADHQAEEEDRLSRDAPKDEDAAATAARELRDEDASFAELGSRASSPATAQTPDEDNEDVHDDIKLRERRAKAWFQNEKAQVKSEEARHKTAYEFAAKNERAAADKAKHARAKLEATEAAGRKKVDARIASLRADEAARVAIENKAREDGVPGYEAR